MLERELLHYGYALVFLGAMVEADATLLTASFLAHRGYFHMPWVLMLAFAATVLANQIFYAVARAKGMSWLSGRAGTDQRLEKILSWSRERGGWLLLASRFLFGLRTLTPLVCGATGMRAGRFAAWNVTGAVVWTAAFGAAGYFGAHALTWLVDDVRRHEKAIAAALALGSLLFIGWRTHGRDWYDIWSISKLVKK